MNWTIGIKVSLLALTWGDLPRRRSLYVSVYLGGPARILWVQRWYNLKTRDGRMSWSWGMR